MSHQDTPSGFRLPLTPVVLLVVILGVGLHVFAFLYIDILEQSLREVEFPDPAVAVPPLDRRTADSAENDRAILLDTAPLFLPTRWNYTSRIGHLGYPEPEPDPIFQPFSPRLWIEKASPPSRDLLLPGETLSPYDLLEGEYWEYFSGFGQSPQTRTRLTVRPGFYRVIRLPDEVQVQSGLLAPSLGTGDHGVTSWTPVRLLFHVQPGGGLSTPFFLSRTGEERRDRAFLRWLQESPDLLRLPPGYYRIEAGP